MRITYASLDLTPSAHEGASGLTLNGEQVVQAVDFINAALRGFFARGSRSEGLQFSVVRGFDTARQAEAFCLLHPAELADSGDLEITCGEPGDTEIITCTGAVFKGVARSLGGRAVRLDYTFLGGVFE